MKEKIKSFFKEIWRRVILFWPECLSIVLILAFLDIIYGLIKYLYPYGHYEATPHVVTGFDTESSSVLAALSIVILLYVLRALRISRYKGQRTLLSIGISMILPMAIYSWGAYQVFAPSHLAVGLNLAVLKNDQVAAQRLLLFGANAREPFYTAHINKKHHTPLYFAVSKGNYEIVDLLLKYGADPNIPNIEGKTPFDAARKKGFHKILERLEKTRQNKN